MPEFFPPNKRSEEHFKQVFEERGLNEVLRFQKAQVGFYFCTELFTQPLFLMFLVSSGQSRKQEGFAEATRRRHKREQACERNHIFDERGRDQVQSAGTRSGYLCKSLFFFSISLFTCFCYVKCLKNFVMILYSCGTLSWVLSNGTKRRNWLPNRR